jgi:hypothetical protein
MTLINLFCKLVEAAAESMRTYLIRPWRDRLDMNPAEVGIHTSSHGFALAFLIAYCNTFD